MKLPHQQLEPHLAKTLASLYLISTDEQLLAQESVDLIRAAARKAGFSERVSLSVEPGADWGKVLFSEAHSLSIFSSKRIVELQLAGAKPNAATSKILQDIATNPMADTVIIISANKFDSKTEQTAWYKALEKNGVVVTLWPIPIEQLPQWVMQRAKKNGLSLTLDAAKLLAELVEGNLLAAAQEVEKLSLLQMSGTIDHTVVEKAVSDNARFDIFGLVECALSGNSNRVLRMLSTLREDETEPLLILWALTREIRTLAAISKQQKQGVALGALFSKYRIWEKRQPSARRFLQHHTEKSCWELLTLAALIDRQIKGASQGSVWDSLQQLALKMAGDVIIKASAEK